VTEGPTIAAFSGDVDFTMREEVRRRLNELRTPPLAILDLSQVAYMDSMALSEIILLQRHREHEGRSPLRVVVGPKIARLYEISGINVLLPAYASLNDAQAT
jgi:anti-anti-sigma factor